MFTDIEGSTALLQALGAGYRHVLERHHQILRAAIAGSHGIEISTEGDAFFAVFLTAADAINAAVIAQRELAHARWPSTDGVRVRMGLHTGEGRHGGDSYVGIDVHRAARIAATGHGGQIVISDATRSLVEHTLPGGVSLRDLGMHRLKDLSQAEHLYDLVIQGISHDFPPLRSAGTTASRLPAQPTVFVGRKREVLEVRSRLESTRLVTLTGPGGIGKTRLALQVASDLAERFPDGAYFVDLGSLIDPDLVPAAIAQTLGLFEDPARGFLERIVERLSRREALLVLDNLEQLLPAAAATVNRLVNETQAVTVLATSRAPLRLSSETVYAVPPLGRAELPRPDAHEPIADDAVVLYLKRAFASRADFRPGPRDLVAIAEICRRLDGLPLAIELAASRVKLMTPEAQLARLDQGLSILGAAPQDRPQRQQTLTAAIDWSYQLLDDSGRQMLERLSVFRGGFGLSACDEVANPRGALGVATLDAIETLVDSSLVRAEIDGDVEPRFSLLDTVRQFASDRLTVRGEEHETDERHGRHFVARAEEAEPHLTQADQAEWFPRLARDRENFRAAMSWALRDGHHDVGLRLARALWRFWQQSGQVAEGEAQLAELLAMPSVAPQLRLGGLRAAGSLAYWRGDGPSATAWYQEGLRIARELGDQPAEIEGLYDLSYAALIRGDYASVVQSLQESRQLAEQAGDSYRSARVDGAMAWHYLRAGDYAGVIKIVGPALERLREGGNVLELGSAMVAVAQANRLTGNVPAAARHLREALGGLTQYGDLPIRARFLLIVAATLEAHGDPANALRLWSAAQAIYAEIDTPEPPAAMLKTEGVVDRARSALGDAEAERALQDGRQLTADEALSLADAVLESIAATEPS